MLISQIMEKSEAGPFQLLTCLYQYQQPQSIKTVMNSLGLSRSTVLKYIATINQLAIEGGCALKIVLIEEDMDLEIGLGVSPQEIYALFLQPSVKYQILISLLHRPRFSIQRLAVELSISEATLNRHLAGLNQIISEFGLGIHNGSLRGPEHQLRYLYFLLLRQTWTRERLERHSQYSSYQREFQLMERLLGRNLEVQGEHYLQIWFYVTKKRLAVRDKDFTNLSRLMLPYKNHIFYQRIEVNTLRYFTRYALELDEGEAMSLFACLMSFFILPLHTMEFVLGFGGPIMNRVTRAIRLLREENFLVSYTSEHITYVLGQVVGHSYFFEGYVLVHDREYERSQLIMSEQDQALVDSLLTIVFPNISSEALLRKLGWELGQIFYYLLEQQSSKLHVALDIFGSEMTYTRVYDSLSKALGYNQLILLESYDESKSYDLIISNRPLRTYRQSEIYYLQDHLGERDQQLIRGYLF